jgi:hypothetical protein
MNMEDVAGKLSNHDARLENLEDYQKEQNGHLRRIEEKLDRFTWWLVLTLGGVVTTLIIIAFGG